MTTQTNAEQQAQDWEAEHESVSGLELCADCTGLLANGEHNAEYSEYPTLEVLAAAIDENWPAAEGWRIDYAGCTDPGDDEALDDDDDDEQFWHIDFTRSACDGCGSRLGGSRCQGFAWRKRPDAETCKRCGLFHEPLACPVL